MSTYVFKDQTSLRLILTTGVDFNTKVPTTCTIEYIKPDEESTAGSWEASVLSGSESQGKIYVDFSELKNFDELGVWRLWAKIVFTDGRVAYGQTIEYLVKETGKLLRDE